MRLLAIVVAFFCALTLACAQSSSYSEEANVRRPVPVMKLVPGTIAPTPLLVDFSAAISDKCERRVRGKTEITLIVDTLGSARNMQFLKPTANDVDRVAIMVAEMDRFTPARREGVAVAVGESLELKLEVCYVSVLDNTGRKTYRLMLASAPVQKLKPYDGYPAEVIYAHEQLPENPRSKVSDKLTKVGGSVSYPVPIDTPEAEYSDEGRRKGINGKCMVSLFVDTYGLPRDLMIMRSLEPTMDQKALEAVDRYRFKPAMRNGMEPVPVMISVEVNFRLGYR